MEIETALQRIRNGLEQGIEVTEHVYVDRKERYVNISHVLSIMRKNRIYGFLDQDDNKFKLWFSYAKDKDLNTAVIILPTGNLRLITVFPCDVERRKR